MYFFNITKKCQTILVISQATTFNLSQFNITGCVTSTSFLHMDTSAALGDVCHLCIFNYLLDLSAGRLTISFTKTGQAGSNELNSATFIMI